MDMVNDYLFAASNSIDMRFAEAFGSNGPMNGTYLDLKHSFHGLKISEIINELSDRKRSASKLSIAASLPKQTGHGISTGFAKPATDRWRFTRVSG